jgi:hypothetical protein
MTRTLPQRHRTNWDWRLKVYPLIAAGLMVIVLNAAPRQAQVDAGERGRADSPYTGGSSAQATGVSRQAGYKSAPVAAPSTAFGRSQDGSYFVIQRWERGPMREFTMRLPAGRGDRG